MNLADVEKLIEKGRYSSPDQLLNAFHTAAGRSDLSSYFGCFHMAGRFLGTDPYENWTVAELYGFAKPHFERGEGWEYKCISGSRKFTYYPDGDINTSQMCTFDELLENDDFGLCRGTGALVRNPQNINQWLIASYHLSFPVFNDAAKQVTDIMKETRENVELRQSEAAAAELLAELELDGTIQSKAISNSSIDDPSAGGASKKKKKSKKK